MEECQLKNLDRDELEWWRHFQCRFGPGNLPKPGDPILGHRFILLVEDKDSNWIPYHNGRRRG